MGDRDGASETDAPTPDRASGPDGHPYGEDWPAIRERVWVRDGHACTRCGADDRTLQAHHVIPRSAGGPDTLDNLVTLCRPCHGVIHQRNRSFDDVREDAPLFPNRDAPAPVARMRSPDDQVCDRCGRERADPAELLAWRNPPESVDGDAPGHVILCKPCAGLLVDRPERPTRDVLEGNHRFSIGELSRRAPDASVRPSLFAPALVSVRREPATRRERLVDDTPLRFVVNSRMARWTAAVLVGYVGLMLVLTVL